MPLQYVMAAGDVPGGTGGGGGGGGSTGNRIGAGSGRLRIGSGGMIQNFARRRAGRRAALQGR